MTRRQASGYERFQWARFAANPDDPNLSIGYVGEVIATLDAERLEAALAQVIRDHFPGLLGYFVEVGDELQVRSRPMPARLLHHCARPEEIFDLPPIDPAGQQLVRFSYCAESGLRTLLRFDFSHLVFDGGCLRPFFQALARCWHGEQPAAESSEWAMEKPDHAAAEEFWRQRLAGAPLRQPLGLSRSAAPAGNCPVSARRTVPDTEAQAVHRMLREQDASLLHLVVAVTGALLHNRTADDEAPVVMAHTVDARQYGQPYGCYTNLLPLWLAAAPSDRTVRQLLTEVESQREDLRPHQHFPTLELLALAASDPEVREPAGGARLNVVVNSSPASFPSSVAELAGVELDWLRGPETATSSELTITYSSDASGIQLAIDSHSDIVTPAMLSALADDCVRLLRFAAEQPDRPLSECDLSRPRRPVSVGPPRPPAAVRSLGELILDTAAARAEQIAVVDEAKSLSYHELSEQARAVAAAIAGDAGPIGVFLDRSAAIPVCYLAALVLGRPFVPLDPVLPDERLARYAAAAGVRVLLADAANGDRARRLYPEARVVDISEPMAAGSVPATARRPADRQVDLSRTAYVLFTSGSTGTPKGVEVSEDNLLNFLQSVADDPGIEPDDRVLAITPISFDISLLELLLPLLCGSSVEVLSDEARLSGAALAERLDAGPITMAQATPSTWRILQDAGWHATRPMTLLCGGEHLEPDIAEYLLRQGGAVYTMYGPTEATIWSSWHRVNSAADIHLGLPARATRYYVLDAEDRAVAPGVVGELVIAGDCVAKGYLNAADTPFRDLDGQRAYWTGDLVRHDGEGRLVFLGRKDNQRKVNGYRVEPGEVAAVVRAVVPEATVFVVIAEDPEPHLRCLVWLAESQPWDAELIRRRCRAVLPPYLLPKTVHRLRRIPLTPNGKADTGWLARAPLAELDVEDSAAPEEGSAGSSPVTEDGLIGELQALVAAELQVPAPDPDHPLGYQGIGSLGYNVLAVRISERYDVRLRPHDFYRLTTLRALADSIRGSAVASPVPTAPNAGPDDDRLAIVGMAAVLPGGPDADAFWEALMAGADAIRQAEPQRGLQGEFAGFLGGVRGFDARFFSISPLEASSMDPRQRLLLQSSWHAIEDSGRAPSQLRGTRTGCYVAATGADYAILQARSGAPQAPHSLVGSSASLLANRLSAYFDWTGPSATLDTACSGSLVALVRACRDLRSGACDAAVVAGVNLILDQQVNDGLHAAGLLSPNHRCATFDARADGYVRGEGYGSLVVRRLSDALADRDRILAVVESVAENHGGRANSLTAPNPNAQRKLLLEAYTPDLAARTGYVETHGSGTALGDAIEIDALAGAWSELVPAPNRKPVLLGAVKTNIGHLEAAAGIASVVKVLKAFEHHVVPGNLHFEELNPGIALAEASFRLPVKAESWDAEQPLVAGVSSFGFGGSNAHVVLSEPPRPAGPPVADDGPRLIPLSARSTGALQVLTEALREMVLRFDGSLTDLSYTLCRGRDHLEYRRAWVVSSLAELAEVLASPPEPVRVRPIDEHPDSSTPQRARTAFLQGHSIPWLQLFAGRQPRVVRVPAYPFSTSEYWFTD